MSVSSSCLVSIDRNMDKLPFASPINNLFDLFQKCVIIPCLSKETIQKSRYYTHLSEKSFAKCIVLLLPILGQLLVACCFRKIAETLPYYVPELPNTGPQPSGVMGPKVKATIASVSPIDPNHNQKPIAEQRIAHESAKAFLRANLPWVRARATFVSPPDDAPPKKLSDVRVAQDLDPAVFGFEYTQGVQEDILRDGVRRTDNLVIYGVASQFNGCEAPSPHTIKPGQAVAIYQGDRTQGPQAQLSFSDAQVELINCGGNKGYNGLCKVLTEQTRELVRHGYFMPTGFHASTVIDLLRDNGEQIEYPYIEGIPNGGGKPVGQFLVSAPATGYTDPALAPADEDRKEIEFLCALHAFRAQFAHCIQIADGNRPLIFRATAPGLGVFGNDVDAVCKAFYTAAKEMGPHLKNEKVKVYLQVFNRGRANPNTSAMATTLGLKEHKR